jgi:hypothetical protein
MRRPSLLSLDALAVSARCLQIDQSPCKVIAIELNFPLEWKVDLVLSLIVLERPSPA